MAKQNSKSIGNNYEREIAKKLSLWITENDRDDVLWRENSSGARATTRKKQGKDSIQDGDFVATVLEYEWFTKTFYVDSKCYKEFNPIIINEKNIKSNSIFNQWVKVCNDCPDNKVPVMICKIRDRKTPEFIMVRHDFICSKQEQNIMQYYFKSDSIGNGYNCSIFVLDDFLQTENAKILMAINKK